MEKGKCEKSFKKQDEKEKKGTPCCQTITMLRKKGALERSSEKIHFVPSVGGSRI